MTSNESRPYRKNPKARSATARTATAGSGREFEAASEKVSSHDQEALRRLKKRLSWRARAPVSLRMRRSILEEVSATHRGLRLSDGFSASPSYDRQAPLVAALPVVDFKRFQARSKR
jgi:hypothetical protein